MLMILYGAIAEMGFRSREYIISKGFDLVEKYYYVPDEPKVTTMFGERNLVSEQEFLENTDSLFRYEIGGMMAGFNHQQISDAVCNRSNSLLTLSTKDIGFLSEIKRIYADNVCLVYVYIDDDSLKHIVDDLPGITKEEAKFRFETGKVVKLGYLEYQNIFDDIVLYGGEDSEFNYQRLYSQFERIIEHRIVDTKNEMCYADVFVSCSIRDVETYNKLCSELEKRQISVFDYHQLTVGTDWVSAIDMAIQNAKVIVLVITANALSSDSCRKEILLSIKSAEKNGTMILPLFEEEINWDNAVEIREEIELYSCAYIENGKEADVAYNLAEKLNKLFSAEEKLKRYSREVEHYSCLKMFDQAKYWQEAHVALCDDVYSMSNGSFMDLESCLLSRVKLISILLDLQQYEDALEYSIESLNYLDDGDIYDVLIEQFCLCCAYMNMDVCEVQELALNRLHEFLMFETHYDETDNMQKYMHQHMNDLLDSFQNALLNVLDIGSDIVCCHNEEKVLDDENKIAQYGEMVIALFEELIQDKSKCLCREDLILGYERILNYCKHIGIKGTVVEKCISRIVELSSMKEIIELSESSVVTEALKIYLGQSLPESGNYDVFLSYKSEDEVLARKVYDHLTQRGKVVFFAKETLTRLGESEYEEMIFEAIDHSCHMILIASNPDYLKTSWVKDEWSTFNNEIREGRKKGNLILLLTDDVAEDKGRLPGQLRQKEIIKMSEFRNRLLSYLR